MFCKISTVSAMFGVWPYLLVILPVPVLNTPVMGYVGSTESTIDTSDNNNWDTNCPEHCQCLKGHVPPVHDAFNPKIFLQKMKIINCTNAGFSRVPRKLPSETECLILHGNNITQLRKLPYITGLIYLDLSDNQIQKMDNFYLFSHLKQLKYLSLRNNLLETLLAGSFSGLLNLDHLDLSYNKISTIFRNAFGGLNYLKVFNIRGNLLRKLDPDWFEDMFDIRGLDLSENLLTALDSAVFGALNDLISVKVAQNKIAHIDKDAFSGLHVLKVLDLSQNQLSFVPTKQLQSVNNLGIVLLDGNSIQKLQTGSFSNMNINSLSISFMSSLAIVEKNAFHDLPYLLMLQMHDNDKLIYLDNHAFYNVSKLKTLYLHNNQLIAISSHLVETLPSLEEVHLYHNPLRCDCNAYWVRETIQTERESNYSKPTFVHPDKIKCEFPTNSTGKSIQDIPEDDFSRVCPPTTLQFFSNSYSLDLGEELRLECHGLGVPEPQITWTLPGGNTFNTSTPHDKAQVLDNNVLVVRQMTPEDSGTYSCKADNTIGFDISSTKVKVSNKPIRLVPYTVSNDYISISWNGTQRSMISDYQLHYKCSDETKFKVIHLGPRYHSYTVTQLTPSTTYTFCIIYVFDDEEYTVDCENITTAKEAVFHSGITKIVNEKIIAGLCTSVGFVMAIVCIVTVVRKFRMNKEYEQPFDAEESETINIPLENIYQPLSTPICSSRTSLINSKNER